MSKDGEKAAAAWTETFGLIQRIRSGDQGAWEELFHRFQPALEAFIRARSSARSRRLLDTEDFMLEAYGRAAQHLGRFEYRGVGSFWSFLRTIALNRIIDESRRPERGGAEMRLNGAGAAEVEGNSERPIEGLVRKEDSEAFDRALAHVKPRNREALLMRIELSCPYALIAEECGFPSPDAARVAVHRTIKKVARLMSHAEPS